MQGKIIFMALLVFCCVSSSYAGWTSSGGNVMRDKNNPWFFQYEGYPFPREVTYCIVVEKEYFKWNEDDLDILIQKAFVHWANEFSNPSMISVGDKKFELATESFERKTCNEHVDIVFQFGYLTQEQKNYLKHPSSFVAVAVRTDYNEEILRGKGFIYVSPDNGPLGLKGEDLIDNPWSKSGLLYGVLLHELGHVFGVTHTKDMGLMDDDFPYQLIKKRIAYLGEFLQQFENVDSVIWENTLFSFNGTIYRDKDLEICLSDLTLGKGNFVWKKFWGIPRDYDCLTTKTVNWKTFFYARKDKNSEKKLVGVINTADSNSYNSTTTSDCVRIYLPPEQVVFQDIDTNNIFYDYNLTGYCIAEELRKGFYENKITKERKYVRVTYRGSNTAGIEAIENGEIIHLSEYDIEWAWSGPNPDLEK